MAAREMRQEIGGGRCETVECWEIKGECRICMMVCVQICLPIHVRVTHTSVDLTFDRGPDPCQYQPVRI